MDLSQSKPAWTSPFARETLRRLSRTMPLDDITPEWAWGGSTGGGVRVADVGAVVKDYAVTADIPTTTREASPRRPKGTKRAAGERD